MNRAALIVCLFLCGCGSPLEKAYKERVAESRVDCLEKRRGDEFKPLGALAWLDVVRLRSPMTFQCLRFGKVLNTKLAIYRMRVDGQTVTLEIE